MKIGPEGLLAGVRYVASPNRDARPPGCEITLLVVHSISLPPGEYGGDGIERLFTNRLNPQAHPHFGEISSLKVSTHFLVRRDGEIVQFVPVQERAWHAGASSWRGRGACNDFSIGVELEGTEESAFEDAQYQSLSVLIRSLRSSLPLKNLAAHSDVAPGRKTDPGAHFDWARLLADLARP